jgi:hypothetical protein
MATVTHHGWSKPSDDIPQPVGVVLGRNLRPRPPLTEAEKVMQSIADFCAEQKRLAEAVTSKPLDRPRLSAASLFMLPRAL